MRIKFGLIFLLQFFLTVYSQNITNPVDLFDQFENGGEVYFRFKNENLDIEKLTNLISIDHKSNKEWICAYAGKEEYLEFMKESRDKKKGRPQAF